MPTLDLRSCQTESISSKQITKLSNDEFAQYLDGGLFSNNRSDRQPNADVSN